MPFGWGKKVRPANVPPDIRTYIEGILEDAGRGSVSGQTRENAIEVLADNFDYSLELSFEGNMAPEQKGEYQRLKATGFSIMPKEAFLRKCYPDLNKFTQHMMTEYRKETIRAILAGEYSNIQL